MLARVVTTTTKICIYVYFPKDVESFLHKDVSFVVTGSQEYLKQQKRTDAKAAEKGTNDETSHPTKARESVVSKEKQRTGNPRPMVLIVTHIV